MMHTRGKWYSPREDKTPCVSHRGLLLRDTGEVVMKMPPLICEYILSLAVKNV